MSLAAPELVIRPTSGWRAIQLRELWQFRDLLLTLAARDLKLRYKQTALGIAWVLLQPLLAAGIFAFVFGKVAGIQSPDRISYFLFAFVGMVAWQCFSMTLQRSAQSLLVNAHLVSRVYFPRLLLPMSTLISSLVDLIVGLGLLALLLVAEARPPGMALLALPFALGVLMLLGLGIGLLATAAAVRFRDVQYLVPVGTQLLLYASPVAYPVDKVPPAYEAVYHLNPLVAIMETFRWTILGTDAPGWGWVAYSVLLSAAAFWIGAVVFRRMERTFADVI